MDLRSSKMIGMALESVIGLAESVVGIAGMGTRIGLIPTARHVMPPSTSRISSLLRS